jgi:beta-lactamase regulating signal transducer with metallopeptidase domain
LTPTPRTLSAALTALIPYLPWLWLIGTPLTFALLLTGVIGTRRLGRASRPVEDGPIADLLARLTTALHITRRVTVAVCERIAAPVLIGILRPMILLPPAALTGWSPDEIEMVLLHELAHVRRWDNLANLLQRCIESLLFFHPAVWFISTWVRRERESCCDATVVARTNRPHAYAELLLNLATTHPAACSLALPFSQHPLRTRIRHILQLEDDPMLVSGKSVSLVFATLLTAATLAVVYLPKIGQAEQPTTEGTEDTKSQQDEKQVEGDTSNVSPTTEFPHLVRFEQGASRFLAGDEIKVLEVRGTAKTFEPGNKYWIRGTYVLHSHEKAQLSAYTTAKDAANATSPTQESQTQLVDRGSGNFVLVLPMSYRGWPHVSFYPADGGDGFGGTYFGTDDSVLKKWWDSDTGKSDIERLHQIEQDLKSVEIVVVLFNGQQGGFSSGLHKAHEELAKRHRSLYTYGAKLDPTSPEAKHYRVTDAPTCVVFIGGKETARLDKILSADQLQQFVCNAVAKGQSDTSRQSQSKFPSLEDQKLADLAWKRLGLELEPIGDDDLKRVKALGYDGGLKALSDVSGVQHGVIRTGDILVGLHVWPTTSMKEVAEILNRDDLAELNPLKFYVVRPADDGIGGRGGGPARDGVITGRVTVKISGDFGGGAGRSSSNTPMDLEAMKALAAKPWESRAARQATNTNTPPDKSNLRYDGKPFDDWRNEWKTELSTEKRLEALKALEAFAAAGLEKEVNSAIVDGIYSDSLATAQHTRKYLSTLNSTDAAPVVRSLQSTIKAELSSRRRVDTLRALGAIGPAAASALDDLKTVLATKDPQVRIAAATAIKRIVGKDQYQKPVADVLGNELGIEVKQTSTGVWGAVPRDVNTKSDAFLKFTEDVIKEQQLLFPPELPPAPY